MSDDDIEYFKDNYGLLPTAQYHIASPGYYGYGGYGSDWDATFYILGDDDKGVQLSQYAGEETYDNLYDMIHRIEEIQFDIYNEIKGLDESGELDEEELKDLISNYNFIGK